MDVYHLQVPPSSALDMLLAGQNASLQSLEPKGSQKTTRHFLEVSSGRPNGHIPGEGSSFNIYNIPQKRCWLQSMLPKLLRKPPNSFSPILSDGVFNKLLRSQTRRRGSPERNTKMAPCGPSGPCGGSWDKKDLTTSAAKS